MKLAKQLLVVAGFCLAGATGLAQSDWNIDWHTIDGGGGNSQGSGFSVAGTVGHPVAGASSGGNYGVEGGFWSAIPAETVSPSLTITRFGAGVVISWPSSSTGFVLQQNDFNLGVWAPYGGMVNDDGTNKSVLVNPAVGQRFYRLSK